MMAGQVFFDEYKKLLNNYLFQGGKEEALYEAYENLIKYFDRDTAEPGNLLDMHTQALKDVLNIRSDNDKIEWIYIQRATEFLLQTLVVTDAFILSLEEDLKKDHLTNTYNRLALGQFLKQSWMMAQKEGTPFCLAFIDIDDFKKINDEYGHDIGDQVLKEMAATIKRAIRDKDHLIRYGGEEFVLILNNTSKKQAIVPLERIRKNIEQTEFTEKKLHITVSIGVASYPEDRALEPEELINFADVAMYEAKKRGKNQIVFFRELKA